MYTFLAILQLILLFFIVRHFIKKFGMTFIVDQVKIMFILWAATLSLYNLQVSNLYSPTVQINLIVIFICITFYILSKYKFLEESDIKQVFEVFKDEEEKKKYKIYSIISNIVFVVAVLLFAYNAYKHGLMITAENKIDKQQMDHYAGYIIYMLVICAEIKYILFRNYKKIIDLIICVISVLVLGLTLNRGPIAFLFITIGLYEVFNFINIKEKLSKKQKYGIFAAFAVMILGFIWFFGYVGNLRMDYVLENVYHRTIWEHYGVSKFIPSGFLWVYIYLTSPLENVAFALANESIVGYSFLGNLFYPFVKLGANLLGKGEEFKMWIMSQGSYTPYLEKKVGLNAMSFIPQSFQDLGIMGFIIYVAIFLFLGYISIKIFKSRKKFSSMGKILIYTNITSMMLWSVFDNSLKITTLILNIFFVLVVELFMMIMKRRKENGTT